MQVRGRKHLETAITLEVKVPEDIVVWKMAPKLALLLREGRLTALLAAMQIGFAKLPGIMANVISEVSLGRPRNILDEELQEKDRSQHSVQKYS